MKRLVDKTETNEIDLRDFRPVGNEIIVGKRKCGDTCILTNNDGYSWCVVIGNHQTFGSYYGSWKELEKALDDGLRTGEVYVLSSTEELIRVLEGKDTH